MTGDERDPELDERIGPPVHRGIGQDDPEHRATGDEDDQPPDTDDSEGEDGNE